ncbi:MAG: SDR family oxidoreductase [Chloroflexales bacterium]|nr:SDR family oxidoreductase [Chloroflexales bacterium]
MTQPILVVGGTGRTGRHVVWKLLERGYGVRVLTRDTQQARRLFHSEIEYVQGNVGAPETLVDAVRGARTIITAAYGGNRERPEIVDYQGTRNLLELAKAEGVHPFIFTSTIYVTRPDHYLNADGQILTWKGRAEALIRASGIPYTVFYLDATPSSTTSQ